MVVEAVFDEHHRVIVGIEGLARECTVHIEHSDAIFDGDIICSALLRDGADVVDQTVLRAGSFVPKRKRVIPGKQLSRGSALLPAHAERIQNTDNQQQADRRNGKASPGFQLFFHFLAPLISFVRSL